MYRVLIVDDEMPALRFVQSIIERFATNFQVAGVATSGEQGFQLLEQQMFDLLITDIGMRGMNGIELAQTARREQAQASRQEKKPSVLAKLCPPVNEPKKTARSKRAERELL